MVNSTEFAKRLEKILDFYGLSATAFSERIKFNRSTISHLLSGRNKPSLEFVMKVLHEFPEVELYWLLNGTGSFPSDSVSTSENEIVIKQDDSRPSPKSEIPTQIDPVVPTSEKEKKVEQVSKSDPEIDRIVIFYKDGSFKAYQ